PTTIAVAFAAGCGAQPLAVRAHPALPKPVRAPVLSVNAPAPAPASAPVGAGSTREAPLGAPWGTAHAVTLVAASPDRRWISVCQARADTNGDQRVLVEVGAQGELRGDRLDGYFLDQPSGGSRIDAFGGADPSGRFVAFIAGDRLVLRDTLIRGDTM